jgi:small subunit ribosomal protein S7
MSQKRVVFVPKGSTPLQESFVNYLMRCGKKSIARRVLADTFVYLAKKEPEKDPQEVFEFAVRNVMPNVEVRPKRFGGAVYQIPVEVSLSRQKTLAVRWIVQSARSRKGMPMAQRLALEIIDATNDLGAAYKKKENVKQMAKANKAFAHFARF